MVLICLVGNNEDAEEELKKALELFRLNTDRRKEAMTLLFLGLASFNLDKYEECKGFCMYDLLQRAEDELDLFITSDQNIRYQQNLAGRRIAILELSTNDIARIQAASALIEDAIDKIHRTSSSS